MILNVIDFWAFPPAEIEFTLHFEDFQTQRFSGPPLMLKLRSEAFALLEVRVCIGLLWAPILRVSIHLAQFDFLRRDLNQALTAVKHEVSGAFQDSVLLRGTIFTIVSYHLLRCQSFSRLPKIGPTLNQLCHQVAICCL